MKSDQKWHKNKQYKETYLKNMYYKSRRERDLKTCQFIASNKSNLMSKLRFRLKVVSKLFLLFPKHFFILLEVGYLAKIVVHVVYKWARQLFSPHFKIMSDWFIFLEFSPDSVSLRSHRFTIFQNKKPK